MLAFCWIFNIRQGGLFPKMLFYIFGGTIVVVLLQTNSKYFHVVFFLWLHMYFVPSICDCLLSGWLICDDNVTAKPITNFVSGRTYVSWIYIYICVCVCVCVCVCEFWFYNYSLGYEIEILDYYIVSYWCCTVNLHHGCMKIIIMINCVNKNLKKLRKSKRPEEGKWRKRKDAWCGRQKTFNLERLQVEIVF